MRFRFMLCQIFIPIYWGLGLGTNKNANGVGDKFLGTKNFKKKKEKINSVLCNLCHKNVYMVSFGKRVQIMTI